MLHPFRQQRLCSVDGNKTSTSIHRDYIEPIGRFLVRCRGSRLQTAPATGSSLKHRRAAQIRIGACERVRPGLHPLVEIEIERTERKHHPPHRAVESRGLSRYPAMSQRVQQNRHHHRNLVDGVAPRNSAFSASTVDQALCQHLNRGCWQLDAGEPPPIPLEMHADAAGTFGITEANRKFHWLYERQPAQQF
jgi:hypothetical protein